MGVSSEPAPRLQRLVKTILEHPKVQLSYLAQTNQGFLLREANLIANLMLENATKDELKRYVVDDDLFQLASVASRKTALQTILKRLSKTPPILLEFLAAGEPELQRLTNLYLILLQHRLLREFIAEVALESLSRFSYLIPLTEVKAFMAYKRSQVPVVETWSAATTDKSRSNLVNTCVSAGLLQREATALRTQPQSVPPPLKRELTAASRESFLLLLLDAEAI